MFNFSIITKRYRIPKYEFFARADMIKEYDNNSGMMSMIPIRISLIEECAANEATEIRVLNVR
jgi:hypothetical protein